MPPEERIRVLLLLPSLHGGGAERVASHILNHADPKEFDVRMGLLQRSGPYLADVDPSRVDASRVGARWLDFDKGDPNGAYSWHLLALGAALAPANVVAMMQRFEPHVVVSFRKGMSAITWAAVRLYGRRRVRWIAREGNNTLAVINDELSSPTGRAIVRRLTTQCYRSADRLLTICHGMGRGLVRDLGIPADHVSTVYNTVDLAEVRKRADEPAEVPDGAPFLVAVGRIERQKGFDVLVEAFAKSAARKTHRLVILGEGSDGSSLRRRIDRLDLGDRVLLPGWVDNPWAWMKRASLFVLSSRWEGFGSVVIEALACGLPAIVTDCDFGPKEVVEEGDSGLVVPVDDVDSLQQAMDRILGDEPLAARLAEGALKRAEHFDVPVTVGRYQNLFREMAQEVR